jgi:diadenosine tetraphosphate (Ap4A) HIT family hydrolase
MTRGCEICSRIEQMGAGSPYLVAELETGYAVLADSQYIPGYTIFLCKTCVPELHDLAEEERWRFLNEMALIAEAVFRAFAPRKLNYELLGNSVPHLHWHLFPRYDDDPNPTWPVWSNEAFLAAPRVTEIEPELLEQRRAKLAEQIALLVERS